MKKTTLNKAQITQTTTRSVPVRAASTSASCTWKDAVADYLLLVRGTREEKTVRFYRNRLSVLMSWANDQGIPLHEFRARHLRQYLASRAEQGVSDNTRRHDAVATRAFLKFCTREEYITSDPLIGYQVPKADKPYVKCPSDDEIRLLLTKMQERWNPNTNPDARFIHAKARRFFQRRNYAIITGLIETGARAGEILNLTLDDYQPDQKQIVIRKSKGDNWRIVPVSDAWIEYVDAWLRVRPKVQNDLLFVSEYGDHLAVERISRQFRGYLKYAGLTGFSLHGLRHYALTTLARTDVWAASQIAGHRSLVTTRAYLHGDPAHVRSVHEQAAPLGRLLVNTRSGMEKRRKVV